MKMNVDKQEQTLKPLPTEIRSIVRSGIAINSVAQCVEELVYNSIDAGAKNIHVGVNLELFNVRVEDDGVGLSEIDLESVGVRYTTSKCSSLVDLSNLQSYGFRGEALASIIEVSNTVDIISRPKATAGIELKKKFENGTRQGFVEKYNTPAKKSGTTVIVGKLLSKLPVRQLRIDKSIQLEEVKGCLETIALIKPDLSIELRNEKNGTILFSFKPASCYSDAINQMYMSRIGFEVKFVQEHFLHRKFFFSLSVSNDFVKKKRYQFVFVNNRFIRRCKIHKWVGNFILDKRKDSDSPKFDKYPIFMLSITCPLNEYDITVEPKKQVVEFKDWDAIYTGIDGLVLKLKHKNSLTSVCQGLKAVNTGRNNASLISSYDVKGALHSRFVARDVDEASAKSSCTDSDRESFGRVSSSKQETKLLSRDRNIIRSSHNTHVVNVRDIRKKRKLEKVVAAKALPIPFKPKPSPTANKPRLTLETFKKFPEWKEEFDGADAHHVPTKRQKESLDQEGYKCYVSDDLSNERRNSIEANKEQLNESSNFGWKINRYFQNYKPEDNSVADGVASEDERGNQQNQDGFLPRIFNSNDPIENPNDISSALPPKTPMASFDDVEEYIFSESSTIVKNHFKERWTLRKVKEEIVERLFKYYKATKSVTAKREGNSRSDNVVTCSTLFHDRKLTVPKKISSTSTGNVSLAAVDTQHSTSHISQQTNFPNLSATENNLTFTSGFVTAKINIPTHDQANCSIGNRTAVYGDIVPPPVSQIFKQSASDISKLNSKHNNSSATVTAIPDIAHPKVATETCPSTSKKVFSALTEAATATTCSVVCGSQLPASQTSSLIKPSNLEFLKFNQGTADSATTPACLPPLLNLFPIQKSFSADWNDKMMSTDYTESNDNLFPSDWAAEIVMDHQGQEWLQTLDSTGRNMYINLTSGESSYDISHLHGSLRKVSVGEMKKLNPVRYNWLRRHFPRGFKKFWNGNSREIVKEGDLTKLNNSAIGDSVLKCIKQTNSNAQLSKWTDVELQNASKYFTPNKDSSIKTVNNVTTSGIQCWKNLGGTTSSFRFSREDFELIRVIGQYDRKFILAGIKKSSTENETLVIFDQHAVHERIRLEQLLEDSFKNTKAAIKYLKESEVVPPYQLPLSETEIRIMKNYVELFRQAALKFESVSSTTVKIKTVPKCFLEKCSNEPSASREETFRSLVHSLIQDLIHTIMVTKVSSLSGLPKTVHSALCSQACHGAIKFGDVLDLDACKRLILKLRSCKNLFQCAHGRPSVVPLIKGQDMLKVSAAGFNGLQDRQLFPQTSSVCLPFHEECSNYFCNPERDNTSGNFCHPKEDSISSYFCNQSEAINNLCNLKEDGTSNYFDNSKVDNTSNYFSLLDASVDAKKDGISITDPDQNHPISFPTVGSHAGNMNVPTTSDFFSFMSGEKFLNGEEGGESPYFVRMP